MGKLIKGKHNIEAFMNSKKGDPIGACFARNLRPRKKHPNGKAGYNIVISEVEMDFGGEGVIVHANDIAGMETLIARKQSRIEELEARMILAMQLSYSNYPGYVTTALRGGIIPEDVLNFTARTCLVEGYEPALQEKEDGN